MASDDVQFSFSIFKTLATTKLLLVLVGFIQIMRHQISFYHCFALFCLCQLLNYPSCYFLNSRQNGRRVPLSYAVFVLISSFSHILVFLAFLPIASNVVFDKQEWCIKDDEVFYFVHTLTAESMWEVAPIFQYMFFLYFEFTLILDAVKVAGNRLLVNGHEGADEERLAKHLDGPRKIHLVFISTLMLTSIITLNGCISWLYDVSSNSDSGWDYGQILALAGVVLDIGKKTGKHLWETVPESKPPTRRYKIFWRQSCISF